jgi:hypothetical protein
MSWQQRTSKIAVGDRVCYSAAFCRNTGQQTGDTPFMRGEVIELKPFGDQALATIRWDGIEEPGKVLTANLSRVTARGIQDGH